MLNFVKGFLCIYWDNHMAFIFQFLMWCVTLIDLWILKNPCITAIKPTWSWCMIFIMCCWIQIARILLRIFLLCSSVILACSFIYLFFFVWHLCQVLVLGWWWPHRMSLEVYFHSFLCKFWFLFLIPSVICGLFSSVLFSLHMLEFFFLS